MKDEIKEILDRLRNCDYDDFNKVLDYITNLQEELKSANESIIWWSNRFKAVERDKKDYKSRNEKAIEYFKYQLEQLDFYEDTKAKMLCAMGIVILQGEDKDE